MININREYPAKIGTVGNSGARCHTAVPSFNLESNYISHSDKKLPIYVLV